MSKSWVTISLCPICSEETGELLLDRNMKERFEMHTTNPCSPCDKCRETYLKEGVLLINPETCSLVVLKDDAFQRIFEKKIPKGKICFAEEGVIAGLMKAQREVDAEVNEPEEIKIKKEVE